MNITEMLNSGQLHKVARERRPECIDRDGNIHVSSEGAAFVDWVKDNGKDHPEYADRYVPSH